MTKTIKEDVFGANPQQTPASSLRVYAPLEEDGQKVIEDRRRKRQYMHMFLLAGYFLAGVLTYWILEGWNPLQSILFTLAVTTGVGYGHLMPTSQLSMFVTAIFIVTGLAVFAALAGQVLDILMQTEIEAVSDLVDAATDSVQADGGGLQYDPDRNKKHHETYHEKRYAARRNNFLVGCANMSIIYCVAVIWFMAGYGQSFFEATYFAAMTSMKLDSLCTIDGIHCAPDFHDNRLGETKDLILSILWCFITYSTIAHFCVATAGYMGADPEPVMTKINHLTKNRWHRMDKDGDGKVNRSDFLRDRLIQAGVCEREAIDRILRNFDQLDKNKSGKISLAEAGAARP
jgi:hypothetical protein